MTINRLRLQKLFVGIYLLLMVIDLLGKKRLEALSHLLSAISALVMVVAIMKTKKKTVARA